MKKPDENFGREGGYLPAWPASSRTESNESQRRVGYWMPVSVEMAAAMITERTDFDAELIELNRNYGE